MQDEESRNQPDDTGVDVTQDSPLPDVPQASADTPPMLPPEPVDISTARLNTDAFLTATTFDEGADRTLYEQALDAYEESDESGARSQSMQPGGRIAASSGRRVRMYDVKR